MEAQIQEAEKRGIQMVENLLEYANILSLTEDDQQKVTQEQKKIEEERRRVDEDMH